jgi:uncharacterized membrane protein
MATSTDIQTEVAQRVHHAKEPLSPVAGPYGHPFHPILVTIPIGAWAASLIFDIATRVNSSGSKPLTDASYWLIGIGVIGALLAAVFGLMDLVRIPRGTRALRVGLAHMTLNLAVVGIFIADFFWRHDSYYDSARTGAGQLALSAVGIGLLLVSGWLGGMLAYRFGVRVAAEARQVEGFTNPYPS